MKKMTRSDKMVLEELQDRYGLEAIADAIVAIADNTDIPMQKNPEPACDNTCCKCDCGASVEEGILIFIKELEGFRIRLREIHWAASHNSLHKLSDDLLGYLESLEDTIAEDIMGFTQVRIKPGDIVPIMTECDEMKCLLDELEAKTLTLRCCLEDFKQYSGMISKLDDLISEIHKDKYLSTME